MVEQNNTQKARIASFDILKGVAIILVVLGHTGAPFHNWIYSIHLPIFFLISGYFYKDQTLSIVFLKKAKSYLLPYFFTCLILLTLALGGFSEYDFGNQIIACIWGKATMVVPYKSALFATLPRIGAIWFLLALFWADILLHIILKVSKKVFQIPIVLTLLFVAIFSFRYMYLPFSIQSGCAALIYVYVGYILHLYQPIVLSIYNSKKAIWEMSFLMIWTVSALTGGVNIAICEFNIIPLGLIGSICGSILVFIYVHKLSSISRLNVINNILMKIGSITLFILIFHLIDLNVIHMGSYINYIGLNKCVRLILLDFVVYPIYMYIIYVIMRKIPHVSKMLNLK